MTRHFVFGLLMASSLACRHTGATEGQSALSDVDVAPSSLFSDTCSRYSQLGENERSLFDQLVGSAFEQRPSVVMGSKTCAQIWTHFVTVKKFTLYAVVPDLSYIAMIAPIEGATLVMQISDWPKHLEALASLKLAILNISSTESDYHGISPSVQTTLLHAILDIQGLRHLSLERLGMSDLSTLSPLVGLRSIYFSGNSVVSLVFLKDWFELREIHAWRNQISDLTPLKALLSLELLDVSDNQVSTIDPLMFLANMMNLNLNRNPNIAAILALQFMPNLKQLAVENANIASITALQSLPLEILNIRGNPITSIETLRGAPLKDLFISNTQVADLSPATSMTQLRRLVAGSTLVTTFPVFPPSIPIGTLDLQNTQVQDLCPVFAIPTLINFRTPGGSMMNKQQIQAARCH